MFYLNSESFINFDGFTSIHFYHMLSFDHMLFLESTCFDRFPPENWNPFPAMTKVLLFLIEPASSSLLGFQHLRCQERWNEVLISFDREYTMTLIRSSPSWQKCSRTIQAALFLTEIAYNGPSLIPSTLQPQSDSVPVSAVLCVLPSVLSRVKYVDFSRREAVHIAVEHRPFAVHVIRARSVPLQKDHCWCVLDKIVWSSYDCIKGMYRNC